MLATVWNGHDFKRVPMDEAKRLEAEGLAQISDNIGAHKLLFPRQFEARRAALLAEKSAAKSRQVKAGTYKTTVMKAEK